MISGIKKQLSELAKKKKHTDLFLWIKSITNHLYWCISSSEGDERVARWCSVYNHIQNIHTHESPLFPRCTHGQLERHWIHTSK